HLPGDPHGRLRAPLDDERARRLQSGCEAGGEDLHDAVLAGILSCKLHLEPVQGRVSRPLRADDRQADLPARATARAIERCPLTELRVAEDFADVCQIGRGLSGERESGEGAERDRGDESAWLEHDEPPTKGEGFKQEGAFRFFIPGPLLKPNVKHTVTHVALATYTKLPSLNADDLLLVRHYGNSASPRCRRCGTPPTCAGKSSKASSCAPAGTTTIGGRSSSPGWPGSSAGGARCGIRRRSSPGTVRRASCPTWRLAASPS